MTKEFTRTINVLGLVPIAGQIIAYDDFENIYQWTKHAGVGDYIIEIDPSIAKNGNQSLLLKSRTEGATEDDQVGVYRQLYLLPDKIISLNCDFRFPVIATIKTIYFLIQAFDTTHEHVATLIYYPNVPEWTYHDYTGGPVSVPNSGIVLAADAWHRTIIRTNFETKKYLSLQADDFHADLSGITFQSKETLEDPHLKVTIFISTAGAAPAEINLDQIIIGEI